MGDFLVVFFHRNNYSVVRVMVSIKVKVIPEVEMVAGMSNFDLY